MNNFLSLLDSVCVTESEGREEEGEEEGLRNLVIDSTARLSSATRLATRSTARNHSELLFRSYDKLIEMGIIFSNSIDNDDDPVKSPSGAGTDGALFEKNITSRSSLRVESHVVQKLAETYSNHYYLPIAGRAELWSLVSTV